MIERLIRTGDDGSLLLLRLVLGGVMLPHGAQKLLGWFGGGGVAGTLAWFRDQHGVPAALAMLVILAESLGALALVLGLGGRFMASGIAAVMLGTIWFVHASVGFFMNWSGTASGEGFEYHLLALAMAGCIIINGSGAFSLDRLLMRGLPSRRRSTACDAISCAH
jgi:putative oxidoreductase